jgi:polysaccharide pyruvyl transferase WcaK-like protein
LKSFVVGWYGHGNIGDELLSVSAYKIFRDAFKQHPTLASVDPQVTSKTVTDLLPESPVKCVRWPASMSPKDLMSASFIRTFSSVVESGCAAIGGGGMFSDWKGSKVHRWLEFISLCKKLGKKTVLLGIGAGPFFDGSVARRVGTIINNDVDLIIARDDMSKKYLEEQARVTKEIKVLPDLVFYLHDILKPALRKSDVIVANFIPFPDLSHDYEQGIINFLEDVTRERVVELLPFHQSDWRFHKKLSKQVKSSNLRSLPLQSIKGTIDILSSADAAVLTRFHSIILGAMLETPVVPLVYHHKSAELLRRLGIDKYAIDVGDGSQWKDSIPSVSDYCEQLEHVKKNWYNSIANLKSMSEKQSIESRKYVAALREI